MRLFLKSMMGVACALLIGTAGFAQENPTQEQLTMSLVNELPSYFEVEGIEVRSAVNDGDAVTPIIRQRIVAEIEAAENLYNEASKIDGISVLNKAASSGTTARLYGVAASQLRLEQWQIKFDIENSSTLVDLGQPRDFFPPNAVISGSAEETALRETALAKQEHERKATLEKQERERQEAEAFHETLRNTYQGAWTGSYTCGQGQYGLIVTIKDVLSDNTMTGEFSFSPIEDTSSAASKGRYELFLTVDTQAQSVTADAGPWIERPSGFESVGFTAELREDTLIGRISHPGCGSLKVARSVTNE